RHRQGKKCRQACLHGPSRSATRSAGRSLRMVKACILQSNDAFGSMRVGKVWGGDMRRRSVLLGGLGFSGLAAPAIRPAGAQSLKPLVIGGSVPLTGAAAETGLNVNNGYI